MMWRGVVRDAEVGLPGISDSGLRGLVGHGRPPYARAAGPVGLHQLCNSRDPMHPDTPVRPLVDRLHTGRHERLARRQPRQRRQPLRTRQRSAQPEGARVMRQSAAPSHPPHGARPPPTAAGCRRSRHAGQGYDDALRRRRTTPVTAPARSTAAAAAAGSGPGGTAAPPAAPGAELAATDQVDRDHAGRRAARRSPSARTSGPTPSCSREVDLCKVDRPPGGRRGHELPDRRLRQPRGHVRRGEEEPAHRLRRGQAHRLDDDPARRRQRHHADLACRATRDVEIPAFTGSESGKQLPGHGQHKAQRGLRRGRPRAARAHRRVQHRPAHRPLRRDRLRRLREDRRRGRRRRDGHPDKALQGQVLRRRLPGGQADAERRAVPGLRPHPARLRRAATWTARRTSRSSCPRWPTRRPRRRRCSTRSSSTRRWAPAWTP